MTSDNDHREGAALKLIEHIFDTRREKLAELTNVPLDQVRPLSMMQMYVAELKVLAVQIIQAQIKYSQYRQQYYPDERIYTLVDFEQELKDINESIGPYKCLAEEWLFYWLQLRRSVHGDHLNRAGVLAQDQIAATQPEGESIDYDKVQ